MESAATTVGGTGGSELAVGSVQAARAGKPRALTRIGLMAFATLAAACASLPTDFARPEQSVALAPSPDTVLGRHVAAFAERHGPQVSGFAAIDGNGDGLWWRLALVDSAERSLDMLYYLWYGDPSGLLLLEHVIAAADRGVRVRVVVDDTLFLKGKKDLANIEAHPNIDLLVYNPWASAGVGRLFETLSRAKTLNSRMHNKLLIADGQMAILGGRNVGDHYFGLHHKYNFHDLDLLVAGADAEATSAIFDHFWNSDRVIPASAFVDAPSWDEVGPLRAEMVETLRGSGEISRFPLEPRDWNDELAELVGRLSPGTASVEFDRVLPGGAVPSQDGVVRLAEMVGQARDEVLILNAYVLPGERMMELLRDLDARGVRVRMLTNSLASNDVPAVTAKFRRHRKPLLDAGVELYELRADPEIQSDVVDTPPVEAKFAGFHTKAAVVDRRVVYVGSLNLDPRSIRLNTEMGLIVDSPGLAEEVAAIAERDMSPENSWEVRLDERGELRWESSAGVLTRQPAQSAWQRFQAWLFRIVPESQL